MFLFVLNNLHGIDFARLFSVISSMGSREGNKIFVHRLGDRESYVFVFIEIMLLRMSHR